VQALGATLDPVQLLSQMRAAQRRLVAIADRPIASQTVAATPPLEQFLSNLRTAWKEGEVRPTPRAKAKAKRLRRRPDPFATVSEQLRAWFDAEPKQTGRVLLNRLQSAYPGVLPSWAVTDVAAPLEGMASGDGAANGIPDHTWASDRRAHARITFMIARSPNSLAK
jgi:hypothetical protein